MQQAGSEHGPRRVVRTLHLRNYKSIAECRVDLPAFAALVGPNGAGKSNVLDSLRFVSDSLRNSLEFALRDRGGIGEVRRRSSGHPTDFTIELDLNLSCSLRAVYGFTVGASEGGGFFVKKERCCVWGGSGSAEALRQYRVEEGRVLLANPEVPAAVEKDRLFLGVVSGLPAFRPVFDALRRMGFYNLNPARMRELQPPSPGEILSRDGANIASIVKRLEHSDKQVIPRIEQYLSEVVPGLKGAKFKALGPRETLEFLQEVAGAKHPWRFHAANMSDGTLRALGVLVALFQGAGKDPKPVSLVGIEEPETALHPAATAVLADAMLEATLRSQVVVTSHSPDLLDNEGIACDSILAVVMEDGKTIVGPVNETLRGVLRDGLYTPGELLRIQQVEPVAPLNGQESLFRNVPQKT